MDEVNKVLVNVYPASINRRKLSQHTENKHVIEPRATVELANMHDCTSVLFILFYGFNISNRRIYDNTYRPECPKIPISILHAQHNIMNIV